MQTGFITKVFRALLVPLVLAACDRGDYGDAPDGTATGYPAPFAQRGRFPTTVGNGGPIAVETDIVILGQMVSVEENAQDPNDPDGVQNLTNQDSDDGLVDFTLVLDRIPPLARTAFQVSAPAGSPGGSFFLNVLIDMNMNGEWGGAQNTVPEWAVRNFPFTVASGQTVTVSPPAFPYGTGNRLPDPAWMRVVVSDDPVNGNEWSGEGRFPAGEIEDHLVMLPDTINGKRAGPLPVMVCNNGNTVFFRGAPAVDFNCTITNMRARAGNVNWTLQHINGGVTVVAQTAGPVPPAAMTAAPALGSVISLQFRATRGLPLPSQWQYRAWAVDPPARVVPEGIILGFGDSEGIINFDDGEKLPEEGTPPPEEEIEEDPGEEGPPE